MQTKKCPNCGGILSTSLLRYPWYKCQSCGKKYHGIYLHFKKSTPNVNITATDNNGKSVQRTKPRKNNNSLFKKLKGTAAYEFCNKNKLWLIPSIIALCIVLIFVSAKIRKANYIKNEFAYAAQAQASEDYSSALYHIDRILQKDAGNEKALSLKSELEILYEVQRTEEYIRDAKNYIGYENYISAYDSIMSALYLDPDNEEALKLKDEILPLYQVQKQQKEEEEAKEKAEREAKEQAEAEEKARQEAEKQAQKEAEEKAKKEAEEKAQQEAAAKAQSDLDNIDKAIEDTVSGVNLDKTYNGNGYTINYPSSYTVEREDDFVIFTDPSTGANISITGDVGGGSVKNITKSDIESSLGFKVTDFYMDKINGIDVCVYDYSSLGDNVSVFIYGASKNYMAIYQRSTNISAEKEIEMVKVLSTFRVK